MKRPRVSLAFLAAALFVVGFAGTAAAFHSGGVAECTGCHSMHSPKPGGDYLLIGSDAASTCLTCHENPADTGPSSYHISTIDAKLGKGMTPLQRTPGGDFGWVKKTYDYVYQGNTLYEYGNFRGHNIVALDNNYVADPDNPTSPGGSFPSSMLSCVSCHDPHGQARRLADGTISNSLLPIKGSGSYPGADYEPTATDAVGVYRLLAGPGYEQENTGTVFLGAPAAKVPSSYNRTEAATQTRAAYGHATSKGHQPWGKWCATCHEDMHSDGNYVHPVDETLGSTVANNYNFYVKTGDISGTKATSYSSLVPFIENTADYVALGSHATTSGAQPGPESSDRVACLSCHRAHASGMEFGLRFDLGYEFMTKCSNYIGSDNGCVSGSRAPLQHRGRTIADWQASYYDRPAAQYFASYQRVLCNKCHKKD